MCFLGHRIGFIGHRAFNYIKLKVQVKNMHIHNILKKEDLIMLMRSLCLCSFIIFFVSNILFAKTEVLFSPRGAIKDAIIKNINSSEKSIDIAVLIFTAGEIAEALYEAKERGVKIRIIIDRKQEKKRYPVLEFLKEKDFDLRFLKGNIGGFMNHTFAIFDVERLVTGSYNWTEYAEKFNYENALFIDEPDTIKSFQEEFESLYGKSSMDRIGKLEESGSYISSSKVEAITERNNEQVPSSLDNTQIKENITTTPDVIKKDAHIETHVKKEQVESAIESSKNGFLNISFMEFNNIFGKESTLGKAEKKQLWKNKFKGKDVRWTGKVIYKGIAVYDWNRIVVEHEGVDTSVQLRFDWTKRRTVMRLNVGDVVTYTGRLVSLQGFSSSYKLAYADVLRGRIK